MDKVVVLGLGNLLMRDDGVGIHLARKLKDLGIGDGVEIIDGGTSALDFLLAMDDVSRLIIVDAIRAGGKPGEIYKLDVDDSFGEMGGEMFSLHELSVAEAISLARKVRRLPPIVIIGIEPGKIDFGMELSPEIESKMGDLIDLVLREVRNKRN